MYRQMDRNIGQADGQTQWTDTVRYTVVVKIKFRFSIRTTAVERVKPCRIEPFYHKTAT